MSHRLLDRLRRSSICTGAKVGPLHERMSNQNRNRAEYNQTKLPRDDTAQCEQILNLLSVSQSWRGRLEMKGDDDKVRLAKLTDGV
jgi:hypothetical protein